jgi:hypothetical protein
MRSVARALCRRDVLVHHPGPRLGTCKTGGISMLAQAIDFQAEADELQILLATLDASDWERATLFKKWTSCNICTTAI